jgi:membrane protein YdbS with pleckstrin-like domain
MSYRDGHVTTITPSHWTNMVWYAIGLFGLLFGVYWLVLLPIGTAYYTSKWMFQFSETSIIESKGILSITHRELLYYRIKSIKLDEPLWMRFFGLSVVTIMSSDPYLPELKLYGIKHGKQISKELRQLTNTNRKENGVKEMDIFNLNK